MFQFHFFAEPVKLEFFDFEVEFAVGLRADEVLNNFFRVVDEPEMKAYCQGHQCADDPGQDFQYFPASGFRVQGAENLAENYRKILRMREFDRD